MARAAALLLGAALVLCASLGAARAAEGGAPPKCKPGCTECAPLTGDELTQWNKAKEGRMAKLAAKLGGKAKAAREGGHHLDLAPTKCTKCAENFSLKDGRCVCPTGFGITFPPKPADGAAGPHRHLALQCTACKDGFASGPDAPRPAKPWWGGKRDLLGKGGVGGGGKGGRLPTVCVKCESGKSNAEHTKCV